MATNPGRHSNSGWKTPRYSVHAAISTGENIPILSSDDIYRDLDVKWMDHAN